MRQPDRAPILRDMIAGFVPPPETPRPPPGGGRIVAAMSGGVDSAVAAALLVAAGWETIGVTLQLYDPGRAAGRAGSCCAGRDARDAAHAAERLGIAHYVLDFERRFAEQVVAPFADAYAAGETPVPCVACNQTVKFTDLLGVARDLGAAALATGHHIRRVEGPEGPELRRAVDPARDQSWFLFATTAAQLDFLRFPVGGLLKSEVRAIAAQLELGLADKPDSQDICFAPDGRHDAIVRRLRPDADAPGEIVHVDGRTLGRHGGVAGFTIGQRRGLGLGGGEPLYVVRIEPTRRRVVVGPRAALGRDRVRLRALNWLASPLPAEGRRVAAQLRSAMAPAPAWVRPAADGGAILDLDAPMQGVAPGQAAALYDGDRLLGGGWIAAAELREAADAAA